MLVTATFINALPVQMLRQVFSDRTRFWRLADDGKRFTSRLDVAFTLGRDEIEDREDLEPVLDQS